MLSFIAPFLIFKGAFGQSFSSQGEAQVNISAAAEFTFTPSVLTIFNNSILTFHEGSTVDSIYVWPCDPHCSDPPDCQHQVLDLEDGWLEYIVQGPGLQWFTISNHVNGTCTGQDALQINILSVATYCISESSAALLNSTSTPANSTVAPTRPPQTSSNFSTSAFNASSALSSLSVNGHIGPQPTNITGITSISIGKKGYMLQYVALIPLFMYLLT